MSMHSTNGADNSFGDKALRTENFKHTLNTFLFEKINSLYNQNLICQNITISAFSFAVAYI